jgi:3-oxoacyl-[acyl-carrier-protein] synthase-3
VDPRPYAASLGPSADLRPGGSLSAAAGDPARSVERAPGLRPPTRAVRFAWSDVSIEGLTAEIPPVEVRTAEIEEAIRPLYRRLGFKPGWVESVTGIQARRAWSPQTRFLDGAVRAARRALHDARVDPACVQAVVSCSVYKDRLEPSLASEVQGQLGVPHTALNFDVGNACLGFLTGMVLVANLIESGQIDCGLVVAAEDSGPVVQSTIAHLAGPQGDIHAFKQHLATLTLGSAAGAVVLARASVTGTPRRLRVGTTLSATEHFGLCVGDATGMKTDSVALLREGVALASRTWAELRDLLGEREPALFSMHQVGKAHHEAVVRALGVPLERAPGTYAWLGNIGSCAVPVTAALAAQRGEPRPGETVAWMGIGSGLNCMMLGMDA